MRLLAIFQRLASPGLLQKGALKNLHWLSCSDVLNPEVTFLRTLFSIVMSLTTAMFPLSEVRTVSTMEKPLCAPSQLFSKTFPLTSTLRALLNSRLFFTAHCAAGGSVFPGTAHFSGLKKWLLRISMSDGTYGLSAPPAPPNIRFSVVAERKSFTTLIGPGVRYAMIACESIVLR